MTEGRRKVSGSAAVTRRPLTHATRVPLTVADRAAWVRRGRLLSYATLTYNAVEAVVALAAGLVADSVALVGFGIDSVIEVAASLSALWRLSADLAPGRRERVERLTTRIIGWSFLALAVYVTVDSARALWGYEAPERSAIGIAILALSAIIMPLLARAKRRVAQAIASRTLGADAMQTSLCAYLSVIALAGVALNAFMGWWWADPVAALGLVPIIVMEGLRGVRGAHGCEDCEVADS